MKKFDFSQQYNREIYIAPGTQTGDVTSNLACVTQDNESSIAQLLDTGFLADSKKLLEEVRPQLGTIYNTRVICGLTEDLEYEIQKFDDNKVAVESNKKIFEDLAGNKKTIIELTEKLTHEKILLDNGNTESHATLGYKESHNLLSKGGINHTLFVGKGAKTGDLIVRIGCASFAKKSFFESNVRDTSFLNEADNLLDEMGDSKYNVPHVQELTKKLNEEIKSFETNQKNAEKHRYVINDLEDGKEMIIRLSEDLAKRKSSIDVLNEKSSFTL